MYYTIEWGECPLPLKITLAFCELELLEFAVEREVKLRLTSLFLVFAFISNALLTRITCCIWGG